MRNLLPLLPVHNVLKEVDSDVVAVREIRLYVHREELVDLPLGTELGAEGGSCDSRSVLGSGLHTKGVSNLRL